MKTFQCQFQVFELNSAKQIGDLTHPNICKEFDLIMFYFKAIIASRGYHVYKETSWSNAKINEEVKVELETNTKSLSTDPYACAIKTKNPYFNDWKTVGHIPREISRLSFFHQRRKWERFWNSKVLKMQAVPNSFWWIRSPPVIKIFCERQMGC